MNLRKEFAKADSSLLNNRFCSGPFKSPFSVVINFIACGGTHTIPHLPVSSCSHLVVFLLKTLFLWFSRAFMFLINNDLLFFIIIVFVGTLLSTQKWMSSICESIYVLPAWTAEHIPINHSKTTLQSLVGILWAFLPLDKRAEERPGCDQICRGEGGLWSCMYP